MKRADEAARSAARMGMDEFDIISTVRGRVIEDETGLGVANAVVRVELPHGKVEATTNDAGNFSLAVARTEGDAGSRARVTILNATGREIFAPDVSVVEGGGFLELNLPSGLVPSRVGPTLEKISDEFDLSVPKRLRDRLKRAGIEAMADVRRVGGLGRLRNLPLDAEHPTVRALDAHARLGILPTDVRTNAALADAGFSDVRALSRAPLGELVERVGKEIGADVALRAVRAANVESRLLASAVASRRLGDGNSVAAQAMSVACSCGSCQSATSPLAYLADLLAYAVRHLKRNRGLKGQYYDTANLKVWKLTRTDPTVDFDWGEGSPDPQIHPGTFSVRWTGDVETEFSENYTFSVISSDGVRLWVGGQRLIDDWTAHPPVEHSGTIALTAGQRYPIRLEYLSGHTNAGKNVVQLFWASPSRSKEIVPHARLLTEGGEDDVTLPYLQQTFHQPLADLPAACEMVEKRVRRVRISIEVLRSYLGTIDAPEWYLREAHGLLLEQLGTSYNEIRAARGEEKAVRKQLADRLGFTLPPPSQSPGPIDLLFLDPQAPPPNQLTEESLEEVFGLRSTTRPSLDPDSEAAIVSWRLSQLRKEWKREDWQTTPQYELALIDPDVIGPGDFANPVSTDAAFKLWEWRRVWVQDGIALRELEWLNGFSLDAILSDSMIGLIDYATGGTGTSVATLLGLANQRDQGTDISGRLQDLTLTAPDFDFLVSIAKLDADPNGVVLDDEWRDVWAIVTQAEKRRQVTSWRDEEKQAGITLAPEFFRLRTPGAPPPTLDRWLSDEEARRRWVKRLRPRVEQEAAIAPAIEEAVGAVEEIVLTRLRDWLVGLVGATATGAGPISTDDWNWITRRLQIDARAGACDVTTRVEQAIVTVQGVLFGARNGLLEDEVLALDAPDFDREWRWLGAYATWRAAMLVFLYPENILRPSLRRKRTPAFDSLLERLRTRSRLSGKVALDEAALYERYFTDVSTLEFAALAATSGPYPAEGRDFDAPPGRPIPYWLILARAASGKYYACADTRRPDIGIWSSPNRTFWREIPKLDMATEIAAVFPYRDAKGGRIAVYGRGQQDEATVSYFSEYDGASWSEAMVGGVPPLMVCGQKIEGGTIPVEPGAATRGVKEWRLTGNERMIPADVDGDGSVEIVLVDSRRVGVLHSSEGGLVVTAEGALPTGWQLPAGEPVVLRTELTQTPNRLERLLLNAPASSAVGLFGLLADGRLGLVWYSSGGVIRRSDGSMGWQIDFSSRTVTEGTATLTLSFHQLIGFRVDLDDRSELLAIERVSPPNNATTRLRIHALRIADTGITFEKTLPEIDLLQDYANEFVDWRGWRQFTSYGGGLVALVLRDVYTKFYRQLVRQDLALVALHWNRTSGSFTAETFVDDISTTDKQHTWAFSDNDRLLTAFGQPGDHILLTSTAGARTGMLERKSSFGLVWQSESDIATLWRRAGTDAFVAADLDGDGAQEIVVFSKDASATEQSAGIFKWSNGALAAAAILSRRIEQPGGIGTTGWSLDASSQYVVADVDGDGVQEIITLTAGSSRTARFALLRGFQRPKGWLEEGVKSHYGPASVSPQTIEPKRSDAQIAARRTQIADTYGSNLMPSSPNLADITYLDEAFFHVPMELALRLGEAGDYRGALDWLASLYDYGQPLTRRKIWYGLEREEVYDLTFDRALDWLRDPLDPHAIAATRPNTYTRATLVQVVRMLLAYADSQFTKATQETVSRALQLYLAALELLDAPELRGFRDTCRELIGTIEMQVGDDEWIEVWHELLMKLDMIGDHIALERVVKRLRGTMGGEASISSRLKSARRIVEHSIAEAAVKPRSMSEVVASNDASWRDSEEEALSDSSVALTAMRLGTLAVLTADAQPGRNRAATALPPVGAPETAGDIPDDPARGAYSILGLDNEGRGGLFSFTFFPAPSFSFCIQPNTVVDALRRHAELSVQKIRHCRNIGGLEAHLEPYGGQTAVEATSFDGLPEARETSMQPVPYRFSLLVERSKDLANMAAQFESSMLASIEKRDSMLYDDLRARHDLTLARAGIRLKELQLGEALDGVGLAELQRDRARLQQGHYKRLLDAGLSQFEEAGLAATATGVSLQFAAIYSIETLIEWAGTTAEAMQSLGHLSLTAASFERREEEWEQERRLAEQDVRLGEQQIEVAHDRVLVAGQERALSELQYDAAEAALDFIANKKFTNTELYEWMSGVLDGIYRFFLQQATAMAMLARDQLSFERQQLPPAFIQGDYWQPASEAGSPAESPDRRGLTGSARLLRDIVQLDQYAFRTEQRKLQLTKTISLAELDPIAFQRFRETGILRFATPARLFEQDFPDHYLRLVKRVRTSVLALIPSTRNIHATLSAVGTSRVVIGGDTFRKVTVQRSPESVALTSPRNATGLLELDPQPEMLVPFEGIGVETAWELSMPKPANLFSFSTIADVLFAIDYTALSSIDYGAGVIERLDKTFRGDRAFSLRHEFQDEWFYLHNPDQSNRPMQIEFMTTSDDFPPNVEEPEIQHVSLYFSSVSGAPPASWANNLQTALTFDPDDGAPITASPGATPLNGLISTRTAAGIAWTSVLGESAIGKWTVTLPMTEATRRVFAQEQVEDVLLVVTYRGSLPPWPS